MHCQISKLKNRNYTSFFEVHADHTVSRMKAKRDSMQ